jgi:NDP-sugar pyrophosphorylase family protein
MKAIIVAPGHAEDYGDLSQRRPVELLPLVDRPVIQHVLELLVEHGFEELDFIVCHLPEQLEEFLGDGTRWGATFRFHLAQDLGAVHTRLQQLAAATTTESLFLAQADCLPPLPDGALAVPAATPRAQPVCWRDSSTEQTRWTGWGWFPREVLQQLPAQRADLEPAVLKAGEDHLVLVPEPALLRSPATHLAAQARLLGGDLQPFCVRGRSAQEGVWLGRAAKLDPTADLVPPVYVGDNTRIAAGCRLGPRAVIGGECAVGSRSTAVDALVLSGGYVGELLELDQVIVDRELLVNARLGASVKVPDEFILGRLSGRAAAVSGTPLADRLLALLLLLLTWPGVLCVALSLAVFRRGPVRPAREVVRQPGADDARQWRTYRAWSFHPAGQPDSSVWRHLLTRFLPGLIDVVLGRLALVGTRPRSSAELQELTPDWQAVVLRSRSGLLTEAEARWDLPHSSDERYAADVMSASQAGLAYTLRQLCSYGWRLLVAGSQST